MKLCNDVRHQPRVARCALTLGSVIEPRWGSGGEALLKTEWLHNKRLHADATAISNILLDVASRLRWSSEVDQGGAGEPWSLCVLNWDTDK